MNEKILICVAWPYANGSLHIGQTAGAYRLHVQRQFPLAHREGGQVAKHG